MTRYPNDVDTIEAAVLLPVAGGWAPHVWTRLGRGKFALIRYGSHPTRAAAYDWLITYVDRLDNPEQEDRHGYEAA